MKHKPYIHRRVGELKWSVDFECYVREDFWHLPNDYFLGERWVYLTPGLDTNKANFRGNLSDDWPCIDFGKDFVRALKWLHGAKRRWRSTERLWVKK